jgi:hypothetical protein
MVLGACFKFTLPVTGRYESPGRNRAWQKRWDDFLRIADPPRWS